MFCNLNLKVSPEVLSITNISVEKFNYWFYYVLASSYIFLLCYCTVKLKSEMYLDEDLQPKENNTLIMHLKQPAYMQNLLAFS